MCSRIPVSMAHHRAMRSLNRGKAAWSLSRAFCVAQNVENAWSSRARDRLRWRFYGAPAVEDLGHAESIVQVGSRGKRRSRAANPRDSDPVIVVMARL